MTKYRFTVLGEVPTELQKVSYEERLSDYEAVLQAYLRTFEKRAYTSGEIALEAVDNFSDKTLQALRVTTNKTPTRNSSAA